MMNKRTIIVFGDHENSRSALSWEIWKTISRRPMERRERVEGERENKEGGWDEERSSSERRVGKERKGRWEDGRRRRGEKMGKKNRGRGDGKMGVEGER